MQKIKIIVISFQLFNLINTLQLNQSDLCGQLCLGNFYLDDNSSCIVCPLECKTCSSQQICIVCQDNRQLSQEQQCLAKSGYFSTLIPQAIKCSPQCQECLNINQCTKCNESEHRILTNESNCIADKGYFDDGTGKIPEQCHKYCRNCTLFSKCQDCLDDYFLEDGQCIPIICGDGIYINDSQQCQDGNILNKDGCSSQCQQQIGFQCKQQQFQTIQNKSITYCKIIQKIEINIQQINKISNKNQIKIILNFNYYSNDYIEWNQTQLKQSLNFNLSYQNFYIYLNQEKQIQILISYLNHINNMQTIVSIDLNKTNNSIFNSIQSHSINFLISTNNNLAANYYNQQTYSIAQTTQNIIQITVYLALFFAFLGLFNGKNLAIEMITPLQLTFLSVMTIQNLSPNIAALLKGKYANGYNDISEIAIDIPVEIDALGLSSSYFANYNFGVLMLFIPFLVGFISLILSCFSNKENQKILKNIVMKAFFGYIFFGLLFNCYLCAASLFIQINNTITIQGYVTIMDIVYSCIIMSYYVLYLYLLLFQPSLFKNFTLLNINIYQRYIYLINITIPFLTIACIVFLGQYTWYVAICSIFFIFKIAYVIIHKPFRNQTQNYSSIINAMTCILVEIIISLSISFGCNKIIDNQLLLYFPLIISCLLLIIVIFNAILILKSMVSFIESMMQIEFIKKQDQKYQQIQTSFNFKYEQKKQVLIQNQNNFINQLKNLQIDPYCKMKIEQRNIQWDQLGLLSNQNNNNKANLIKMKSLKDQLKFQFKSPQNKNNENLDKNEVKEEKYKYQAQIQRQKPKNFLDMIPEKLWDQLGKDLQN